MAADVTGIEARVGLSVGPLQLDVPLTVGAGETVAVVGPNGAGKTTLLRALAGLIPLTAGQVAVDGVVLEDPGARVRAAPERRPVAVVFQDHRLFPTMSARENVAFGLRARGMRRADARKRADEWLEHVGAGGLGARRPASLSGGESQRVALARALATEPSLLLLDEPLAAVDAASKDGLRALLRSALAEHRGAAVVVTHDPVDAAALADSVVVLEAGRIVQSGPLADLAARPRSPWVASMLGVNLVAGTAAAGAFDTGALGLVVADDATRGSAWASIVPQAIALHCVEPEGSARNRWATTVVSVERTGPRVRVRLGHPLPMVAEVTAAAVDELGLAEGSPVWASLKATEVAVYPA